MRILGLWWRRQRKVDIAVLWPAIKARAQNLDDARRAFGLHVDMDMAWREVSMEERKRIIEGLS